MSEFNPEQHMADLQRDALKRRMLRQAERLRDMADEVERTAQRVDDVPTPGTPTYANLAASVQHTVLWGLANLSLDSLVTYARDADDARAEVSR